MNKENTARLLKEFKFFEYQNKRYSPKATPDEPLPFTFGCGDGWFTLVYELCGFIRSTLDSAAWRNRVEGETFSGYDDFRAIQVGEKCGTLRFFTGLIDSRVADAIYGAIHLAERLSRVICETCGCPGEIRGAYWIQTRCRACWLDENDEFKEDM